MYSYEWDTQTGGLLLNSTILKFSKEPRPVYYQELDILGFDKYWNYEKDDSAPYMWAEANVYYYFGRRVAKIKGGSLYTAPELELLEEPEPNNQGLKKVNIPLMIEKNKSIMEALSQETIKLIYNTVNDKKKKVDLFYVAFSGGKDSVVVLDLVQKALPHNAFSVVFGDTDMEFPTTMNLVDDIEKMCKDEGITFLNAKARMTSKESWNKFGPPARRIRWCCSVHKTVPVINELCNHYKLDKLRAMMITGVRGDESLSRSDYDQLSIGKKVVGQYSFHPILNWSSAEIFLYIYEKNLLLNEAYKYGFNRVGCIMCPNSSEKHEYIKIKCFPNTVQRFCDLITDNSSKDLSGANKKQFLEIGGWKTRFSGRELKYSEEERIKYRETKDHLIFSTTSYNDNWKTWYKTIGILRFVAEDEYVLEYNEVERRCKIKKGKSGCVSFYIDNFGKNKNSIEFISFFKSILIKTAYCIQCQTCVAECPNRNIIMENGELYISDECVKCHECLKLLNGCIYYNSIKGSTDMKKTKGINRYLSVGIDKNWIDEYFNDQSYEPGNRKTDVMFSFLNDAEITQKKQLTDFGSFALERGSNDEILWAIMLCNLVYTPAFNWYVKNIPFYDYYIEDRLNLDMGAEVTDKAKKEFWNGFKIIICTNAVLQDIGFGVPDITRKQLNTGEVRLTLNSLYRAKWNDANPLVILYSLYKFAEACGDYYQFTLSRLMNHEIDSDGVTPSQIFGLEKDELEKIIKGLSVNYPDYISSSFNLDLDNINLNSEKTSKDVLELFK